MASEIEICNVALSYIGVSRSINSLVEKSKEANACSLHYENSRDSVLSDFPWNFAVKRVALADTGTPPSDWAYAYRYPTDSLRLLGILVPGVRNPTANMRIEYATGSDAEGTGKLIFTDQPGAWIKYVGRITDPNMFDSIFRDALSWRLAAAIAMQITGNASLAQFAMSMYQTVAAGAGARSMEESQEPVAPESEFTIARLS